MTRRQRPDPKRADIKDVARQAGVSVGTVSNVLNRPDFVTDSTRERVQAAIAELHFVRNGTARQLRAGRPMTVGVVVLDLGNAFYTELVRGIEDRLAADGLLMMLCSSDEDPDRERRYLRQFAEQGVCGLLIAPFRTSPQWLASLTAMQTPVVLLDTHSTDLPSVGVDNVLGARLAVRHLLDNGHRRILLANGPRDLQQCRDRAAGAREAVRSAGLDPAEVLPESCLPDTTAEAGATGMLAAWDTGLEVTAVCCVNDAVALGVMWALRDRGVIIPDTVAVVGYDDIPLARELAVPLSSVRQPMREMGWRAADLLLSNRLEHISFAPELVIRASSTWRR